MQTTGAPSATLNLTEVMDNCRIGSLQIRVFVLCLGSLIMDGFDVQAMGYVAPAMLGEWNLPRPTLGPLLSIGAPKLTGDVKQFFKAVVPAMKARQYGRIVNIASISGMRASTLRVAYGTSKAAIIQLTKQYAVELANYGIRVNAVCPGFTDTEIVRESLRVIREKTGRSEEEAMDSILTGNPQRRLIRPEEVADAVRWLCLPLSSSVTGQSLMVDGGEVT